MIYKEGKIHEDSYLELTLELKRHDVLFKSKLYIRGDSMISIFYGSPTPAE